jgi:hypothetical protein
VAGHGILDLGQVVGYPEVSPSGILGPKCVRKDAFEHHSTLEFNDLGNAEKLLMNLGHFGWPRGSFSSGTLPTEVVIGRLRGTTSHDFPRNGN